MTAFGRPQQRKKTQRELGYLSLEVMTDALEAARKPLLAAIDGSALGGGLEIALVVMLAYQLLRQN